MPRLRDFRGRFVKRTIEPPSSPSSSSETSFETEYSNHSSEPQTMEDLGNPPPNPPPNNPPRHNEQPRNNPLYGLRPLQDYLHPPRTAAPSCIMFPPNVPPQEFKPRMIQLLPTFHGLERENPYVHIREFEESSNYLSK